jgi:hypothetical protein
MADIATIYQDMDKNSPVVSQLTKGFELELGHVQRKKGQPWVDATLPSGKTGFMDGTTRVFLMRKVELAEKSAVLFEQKEANSMKIGEFTKDEEFTLLDIQHEGKDTWIKVLTGGGKEGWFKSPKMRLVDMDLKGTAKKTIIYGIIWVLVGSLITVFSWGSGGSSMIITWGLILLGIIQLVQGIFMSRKAKRKAEIKK